MIFLACTCGLILRTSGDPTEVNALLGPGSEYYPGAYPCPECSGQMRFATAVPTHDLAAARVVDVTPQEAFAALCGAGLPSEKDCGEEAVRQLLLQDRVVAVDVKQLRGTNRSVVYSLQFAGGKRLYLGSGPEGAVAYRVATRRISEGTP